MNKTPGTNKRTPKGGQAVSLAEATPHTARAVRQLQLTVGRSGGKRNKRVETRRESHRDVLRGLSKGKLSSRPLLVRNWSLTRCSSGHGTSIKGGCHEGEE